MARLDFSNVVFRIQDLTQKYASLLNHFHLYYKDLLNVYCLHFLKSSFVYSGFGLSATYLAM